MNSLFRRACHGQDGQVLNLVALLSVVLLGMAALSIDIGFVLHAQRELQASADAAATAGALDLSNNLSASTAIATANSYSGINGGKNARNDLPNVTMATGYPNPACLATIGICSTCPCQTTSGDDVMAVVEQVSAPTFFAKLFGITSIKLTASSLSAMKGGTVAPANIVVVVDSTGSMGNTDMTCSSATGIAYPTQLDCAKYGVRTLLLNLDPCPVGATCTAANPVDSVGLLTFPGLASSSDAAYDYTNCGTNMKQSYISAYAAPPTSPPVYTIVAPSSDYKTSDSSTTLNGASSNLVQAIDWTNGNPGNCSSGQYGLQNPAGEGTYYAGVITEAMDDLLALNSTARGTMQGAIILLSDGAANSTKNDFVSGTSSTYYTNDCQQAIAAATTAAASTNAVGLKTWVYSIAYGSSTATGASSKCSTDTSGSLAGLSACTTMTDMASDPTKFYSDDANGCVSSANSSTTTLGQIFTKITYDLLTTRLLPFSLYTPPQ